MSCTWARPRVSPWLEGDLDHAERERVDLHLESCAACREELESLRASVDLLRGLRAHPAPPQLAQRLLVGLRDAREETTRATPLGVALRLCAHLGVAAAIASAAVFTSLQLGGGSGDLAESLIAIRAGGATALDLDKPIGTSAPPDPLPAEIDAALDRALLDAGALLRGWHDRTEPEREIWARALVDRARARGDAAVLAAALRARGDAEALALADRLAATP